VLHITNVDLSELGAGIAARLGEAQPERPLAFRIAPGLEARGDRQLLAIVLTNLLDNAVKFTSKVPRPRIELGCKAVDGEVVYFVSDNGAGFDMAFAGKLFGVFQRLHRQSEFPGTGVGLATVQRVIRRLGGRIWAESAPGAGASFQFTLNPPAG
jgi:light-regulated signal transduction histidine kinase (bacteriophytochrome)